jgi:DNA-binding response OmpR family regulator
MRVLLVEDEPAAAHVLAKGLREQTYAVDVAGDGDAAVFQVGTTDYDAVILDVMLPGRDGFAVCRTIRESGCAVPILMVTARDAVEARIEGLDCGADDYLVKPFDNDELVARVRALLRRSAVHGRVPKLHVGDLILDPVTHEVHRGKRQLVLTHREFALLEYLMRRAPATVTRAEIASHVWRQAPVEVEETNIVDVYVAYLRRKLDTDADEPMLHTVRGVGYVLRQPADDA